jgi:hypothetical protein
MIDKIKKIRNGSGMRMQRILFFPSFFPSAKIGREGGKKKKKGEKCFTFKYLLSQKIMRRVWCGEISKRASGARARDAARPSDG